MQAAECINPTVSMKVLSEEQMDQIYEAACTVLDKTGFKLTHPKVVELMKKAGCRVEGDIVHMPKEVIEHAVSLAPKGYTIYDRLGNPAMEMKGRNHYYGCSTGSPRFMDAYTGEIREATYRDLEIGALVSDALPNIDWVMPMGTTQDTPINASYLYDFKACVTNTIKPIMFLSDGPKESEYIQKIAAAAVGGRDRLAERPYLISYPEPITPLIYPDDVLERAMIAADFGIPQCPGTTQLTGATSPVTMAGTVTLWLAEALMSVCVLQQYKPGAQVFLSGNFGTFDMATTNNTVGSPEMSLCLSATAQFGQRLGLPTWGLAGGTDSFAVDAQAGAESMFSIFTQGMAGLTLIHDVGYMGAGMVCSPQMLVMGDEFCGMARHFMKGFDIDADTLAVEVIDQVGHGGNFLQQPHTFKHFRKELWMPTIIDRSFQQNWMDNGSKQMLDRVQAKLENIIETHKPEPIPDEYLAEMDKILAEGEAALEHK